MSFVDNAPLELTSHADLLRALNDDSPGRRGRPAFLDKFDAMDQDFVPPAGIPGPTGNQRKSIKFADEVVEEDAQSRESEESIPKFKTEVKTRGGNVFASLASGSLKTQAHSVHGGEQWSKMASRGSRVRSSSRLIVESRTQVIYHLKKLMHEDESQHNGTVFTELDIMEPIVEARREKVRLEQSWHAGDIFKGVFKPDRLQIPENVDHFIPVYKVADALDALIAHNEGSVCSSPETKGVLGDAFYDAGDLDTIYTRENPHAKSTISYLANITNVLAGARGSCLAVIVLISSIVIIDRVIQKSPANGIIVTSKNVRGLLATALLIASKMMDDDVNIVTNASFAPAANIEIGRLNKMEMELCLIAAFNLHVGADEFDAYRKVILR